MSSDPENVQRRAPCAAHGLDFDPERAGGCVLCVRERRAAQAGARAGRLTLLWLVGALALLVGGAGMGAARSGAFERLLAREPSGLDTARPVPMPVPAAQVTRPEHDGQKSPLANTQLEAAPSAPPPTAAAEPDAKRGAAVHRARKRVAVRDRQRRELMEAGLREQELQMGKRRVPVTMYKTAWCGACQRAARYMQREGIPVREYDVERDREARARSRQLNPRGTVPTLDIDGKVMVGWNEARFETLLVEAAARRTR